MGWTCPTPSQEQTQEQAGKNNATTKKKKKKKKKKTFIPDLQQTKCTHCTNTNTPDLMVLKTGSGRELKRGVVPILLVRSGSDR